MKKINIFILALRNLRRKLIRTLLLLLIVAVVSGTLFAATIFISGMQNALKIGTYRLGADVLVVPAQHEEEARTALLAGKPTAFYMDRDVLEKIQLIDGVKNATPQLFVEPSSFACCYSVDLFLIAFEPATDFTVTPWLKINTKKPLADNEIITGRLLPIITGASIPFYGTEFTVAGTMEPTGMKFFDQSVFMTMEATYRMAENSRDRSLQPVTLARDKISAVLVQVDETITPDRVAIRIMHDIDGIKAIASDEVINTVRRQLSGLITGIFALSGVLWSLALVMIGFAFYMIVNERQREFGILRAMGAKKKHVFRLIILEAVTISLAGGIFGLGVGAGLLYALQDIIQKSLQLPYLLPALPILQEIIAAALLLALMTGLLSSLLPAIIASRMEPYDAIRKGE